VAPTEIERSPPLATLKCSGPRRRAGQRKRKPRVQRLFMQ
jgi:hypothetical protein